MSTQPQHKEDETVHELETVRQALTDIEASWKLYRARSRELTLRLVTEHHYSVARASQLSGHHRNTIGVWLQIHNAGRK